MDFWVHEDAVSDSPQCASISSRLSRRPSRSFWPHGSRGSDPSESSLSDPKFQGFRTSSAPPHAPQGPLVLRFVSLLSLLGLKVLVPLVLLEGWRGGPHLHRSAALPQPRAAAAKGSLLRRGRHFRTRQPWSCRSIFGQNLPQSRGAVVPTRATCSPTTSLQFSRPPVVIMAGFMLRAWFVARERRPMRAAPSAPGHAPPLIWYLVV
ncbi:hypothetical protein NDU88_007988 [Pleurodeles waltl]|uniref:Uncharacterized protein n=1 Tax=Pleurodeles waltl TaxID=8319 RepID=A0AAV7PQL2_PLEWA|nr:hypothetical protein NDU88_007988 [Pleurodeles waltl]